MAALALAIALAADQASKLLARRVLPPTPGGSVGGPLLAWRHTRPRGLARVGLWRAIFIWLATGIAVALVVGGDLPAWAACAGLAAWGAALGNLVDFAREGRVVDFIRVGPRARWNVADVTIVAGTTLLVVGITT